MSIARITKETHSHRHDLRLQQIWSSARPLFLFAFQRHMMQLPVMLRCPFRSSPLPANAMHASATNVLVQPAVRSSAILCSRLSATIAVRLMSCRGLSYGRPTSTFNAAACILSRLHHLPGRLGVVASFGAGTVREFDLPLHNTGITEYPYCQCRHSGLAFDSSSDLVVGQRWGALFGVYRYHDGSLLRAPNVINACARREKIALDGAGHVIVCEESRVLVLRYSDASCVLTITQPHSILFRPEAPLPEYISDDDDSVPDDDDAMRSEPHFASDIDPVCHKPFQPRSLAVDSDGNIAVFDFGNGVVKVFHLSDGNLLRSIGGRSSGYRPLSCSEQCGIAFDTDGNLVITDYSHATHNNLLVLRYSDGTLLRAIKLPNVQPVGLAFDAAGAIKVY
jgi:hypothetical protein